MKDPCVSSLMTTDLHLENSFTIHERNIQNIAIELYKVINGLSPVIMSLVFPIKDNIKYCSKNKFKTRNIHTAKYGTETLAHLGPKIWALVPDFVPDFIKAEKSLSTFKIKIKSWRPSKCPCKLCKTYINGVGYIDWLRLHDILFFDINLGLCILSPADIHIVWNPYTNTQHTVIHTCTRSDKYTHIHTKSLTILSYTHI